MELNKITEKWDFISKYITQCYINGRRCQTQVIFLIIFLLPKIIKKHQRGALILHPKTHHKGEFGPNPWQKPRRWSPDIPLYYIDIYSIQVVYTKRQPRILSSQSAGATLLSYGISLPSHLNLHPGYPLLSSSLLRAHNIPHLSLFGFLDSAVRATTQQQFLCFNSLPSARQGFCLQGP